MSCILDGLNVVVFEKKPEPDHMVLLRWNLSIGFHRAGPIGGSKEVLLSPMYI